MKNKFLSVALLVGSFALAVPSASFAVSLGLTTGAPTLTAGSAFVDYLDFDPDGDLSTFGAEVDSAAGVAPVGFTELGFLLSYTLADPTVGAIGGFDVFDDDGLFLAGDVFAVGFVENVIELQFNNLSGAAAGSFGSSVLALITFEDALGPNPFASFSDGSSYGASISVSNVLTTASPVPSPAVLPLLLSGMLGLGWFGRRRSAKS